MSVATAMLRATGLPTVLLEGQHGVTVDTLDLGFPVIRAVTEPRPDADGDLDTTAYLGPRTVTITGVVDAALGFTRQEIFDFLFAFCRPDLRPTLQYRLENDTEERFITLRADQGSWPINWPGTTGFTLSFRAPYGIQEKVLPELASVDATEPVEAGRVYDLTFDRTYPASSPIGVVTMTNEGNAYAYPRLLLYGPVEGPAIENQTTGKRLEFPGLIIAGGDFLEIDTREKTIRLNGLAAQSRYSYLDFDVSEWWTVRPGANDIRYYPTVFSSPARADISFHSAWI